MERWRGRVVRIQAARGSGHRGRRHRAVVDAPATLARTPITDTATTTGRPTALSVTLAAPRCRHGSDAGHVLGRCVAASDAAAGMTPRATLSATIAASDTATATDGVASATIATSDTATTTDVRTAPPSRSPPLRHRRRSGCGPADSTPDRPARPHPGMDYTDTAAGWSAARTQAPRQIYPDPRGELFQPAIDNGRRHRHRG